MLQGINQCEDHVECLTSQQACFLFIFIVIAFNLFFFLFVGITQRVLSLSHLAGMSL